jgi:hypothetical protein
VQVYTSKEPSRSGASVGWGASHGVRHGRGDPELDEDVEALEQESIGGGNRCGGPKVDLSREAPPVEATLSLLSHS